MQLKSCLSKCSRNLKPFRSDSTLKAVVRDAWFIGNIEFTPPSVVIKSSQVCSALFFLLDLRGLNVERVRIEDGRMREKILSLKFSSLARRTKPFFLSNRFKFRDLFELIPWLWAEWNFTFYHPRQNNFVPFRGASLEKDSLKLIDNMQKYSPKSLFLMADILYHFYCTNFPSDFLIGVVKLVFTILFSFRYNKRLYCVFTVFSRNR